jgi:hypothetical protein
MQDLRKVFDDVDWTILNAIPVKKEFLPNPTLRHITNNQMEWFLSNAGRFPLMGHIGDSPFLSPQLLVLNTKEMGGINDGQQAKRCKNNLKQYLEKIKQTCQNLSVLRLCRYHCEWRINLFMLAHPGICPLVPLQHRLHYNGYKDGGALSHFLHNSEHEFKHSTYKKCIYT